MAKWIKLRSAIHSDFFLNLDLIQDIRCDAKELTIGFIGLEGKCDFYEEEYKDSKEFEERVRYLEIVTKVW